jgi:fucose 4-O-acetylase-like acetyltransferase
MSLQTPHAVKPAEWLDVARGILITLVVFGHLIEANLSGSPGLQATYLFIYAFHIPAFSFASGYVSRADLSSRSVLKTISSLIQPLVICQILYWIIEVYLLGKPLNWLQALLVPYWILWYLLSLAVWRVMLVLFSRWPHPVLISVLVALATGLIENWGYEFSISRTLVFFPFFLVGHLLAKNNDIRLPLPILPLPVTIGVFITAGFAAYVLATSQYDYRLLYHALSYERLDLDWQTGIASRIMSLSIAAVLIYCFFAVIPSRSRLLGHVGKHSLFPYLSHGLIIKLAIGMGLFELLQKHLAVEVILLGSVLTALALSIIFTTPVLMALQRAIYLPTSFFTR